MRVIVALIMLICLPVMSGCSAFGNTEAKKQAVAAAEAWLRIVDETRYARSWAEAASFFRSAVTEEQWLKSMQTFRKPLGRNLSRKIKSRRYRTEMPGAPDGEYVVIQFKSSFENKKSCVETVTPMRDEDGKWRVSGYYIK